MILDRTNLRIRLSEAKFDAEDDFEVRLVVALRKGHLLGKKRNFRSGNFAGKIVWATKNGTSGIV